MIIRPARREDVPSIVAIYALDSLKKDRELIAHPLPTLYFDAFDLIEANPNQVVLVAEEKSVVIGSLQVTFIQHLLSRALRRAVIEAVFIHPAHQGTGAGTALFRAAAEAAAQAGCGTLELTSNKSRKRAHQFYKRLGFKASHEGFKKVLTSNGPSPST